MCVGVEGDIVWVEIEVRRLTGWVVPTCRIVFVLTLEGAVDVDWRKLLGRPWTVCTLHTADQSVARHRICWRVARAVLCPCCV